MAMMVSPEVAKLFQVLTGEEWPDANEDELRALAAVWQSAAQDLGANLGPGLRRAVAAIRANFAGQAEQAFAQRMAPFVDGQDNYIDAAAELFAQLGDYLVNLALDVEYMKLVSIYSLIALAAEIAWAIAMSPFTGGGSMAWLAARMAIVRFLLRSLLGRLLIQLLQAAVFSIAFQLLIDVAAQLTQYAMGTRHNWNTDYTKNAAAVGAMGAALTPVLGGFGKLLSGGITKFLENFFTNKFGKNWMKKFPDNIIDIGIESLHETLTEALYKYATEGEFEMNPYAATSGAVSGAGNVGGDAFGKFAFDVPSAEGPGGSQGGPQPPPNGTTATSGSGSGASGGGLGDGARGGGPGGGPVGGPQGGPVGGPNAGSVGGPNGGSVGGPNNGSVGGGNNGSVGGANNGSVGGANDGSVGGANNGSVGGGNNGSVGGANNGSVGGANNGSVGGANDGSVGGGNNGSVGGANNGSVGGANNGSVGGGNNSSVGGANNGSVGGANNSSVGGGNNGSVGGANNGSVGGANGGQGSGLVGGDQGTGNGSTSGNGHNGGLGPSDEIAGLNDTTSDTVLPPAHPSPNSSQNGLPATNSVTTNQPGTPPVTTNRSMGDSPAALPPTQSKAKPSWRAFFRQGKDSTGTSAKTEASTQTPDMRPGPAKKSTPAEAVASAGSSQPSGSRKPAPTESHEMADMSSNGGKQPNKQPDKQPNKQPNDNPYHPQVQGGEQAANQTTQALDNVAAAHARARVADARARHHLTAARRSATDARGAMVGTEAAQRRADQRQQDAQTNLNDLTQHRNQVATRLGPNLGDRHETAAVNLAVAREDLDSVRGAPSPRRDDIARADARVRRLAADFRALDLGVDQLAAADSAVTQANQQLAEAQDIATAAQVSATAARNADTTAQNAVTSAQQAVDTTTIELQQATDNLDNARAAAEAANQHLADARSDADDANSTGHAAQDLTNRTNQELAELNDAPTGLVDQLADVADQLNDVQQELDNLPADGEQVEARRTELTNQRDTLNEQQATLTNQLADLNRWIAKETRRINDLVTAANALHADAVASLGTHIDAINTNRDIVVSFEAPTTTHGDNAEQAAKDAEKAKDDAKEAAKQGEVERGLTQLSSLPPGAPVTIETHGPLDTLVDAIVGLTGEPRANIATQLDTLGNEGLANAINDRTLRITTAGGPVDVAITADVHRPTDTRTSPPHQQPAATKQESSSESAKPLSESTASSVPIRVPLAFVSPLDAAGGAMRPIVYVGAAVKRSQKFESTTTPSTTTATERTAHVPTTMVITASVPGFNPVTASISVGLRPPSITPGLAAPRTLSPAAFGNPALTPAPVTVPPAFVDHLGTSPDAARGLRDQLLTQNQNPMQVNVNGAPVTITPTGDPSITYVGATAVDHTNSTSHSNGSSTTRGSDAVFGAGLYGGLKGWFIGAFTDFSSGLSDGTNPANEHASSHTSGDTELVYRVERPMRVGDATTGVQDTVSSTVQVPVPLARSLGLPLPPHLIGNQPVPGTTQGNLQPKYIFGKDNITSVDTNAVVSFLEEGLTPRGQQAVADKFSTPERARDAIYNAMHGGEQAIWQQGGRTHVLEFHARPAPPTSTDPSGQTSASAEDKNADQFRRTYDAKRAARIGAGGAYLPTGTDSPNPNPPKATPEGGLPNPYQGGPTTSGGAPRAAIAGTWEHGYSNKSGYTGKDGRASKYGGEIRDFNGPLDIVVVERSIKTPNWAQRFFLGDRMLFGPPVGERVTEPSKADVEKALDRKQPAANIRIRRVDDAIQVSTPSDKLPWATRPLPPSTMTPAIYLGEPPAIPPEVTVKPNALGEFTNVEHVRVTPNTTEGVYIALAKRVEPVLNGQANSVSRTPPAGSGNYPSWSQREVTDPNTKTTYKYKNSELTRPGTTSGDAVRDFVGRVGSRGTASQGIGGQPSGTGKMIQPGRLTDFNGALDAKSEYSSPRLVDIRAEGTLKRNQAGDNVAGSTESSAVGIDAEISLGVAPKRNNGTGALLRGVLGGGWKWGKSHAVDLTTGGKQTHEYTGPTAFVAMDVRYQYAADMNVRNVFKTNTFDELAVTVDQPDGVLVEMPVAHAIDLFNKVGLPVPPELTAALPDAKTSVDSPAQTLLPQDNDSYVSYSDTTVIKSSLTGEDPLNPVENELIRLGVRSRKWRAEILDQVNKQLSTPTGHVWLRDVLPGSQGDGGLISVPNSDVAFEDVIDIRVKARPSNATLADPDVTPIVPDKQSNAGYVTAATQDKKNSTGTIAGAIEVGVNHREIPTVPPGQPDANGVVRPAQPNPGATAGSFTPQIIGGSKSVKTDTVLPTSGSDKVNTQIDTDKLGRTSHAVDYDLEISRRRNPMPAIDTPLLGVPKRLNWDTPPAATPITVAGAVDLVSPGSDASPPLTKPTQLPTIDVVANRPARTPMFGPKDGFRVESIGSETVKALHNATYAALSDTRLPVGAPRPAIDAAAGQPSDYTRKGSNSEYVIHNGVKGSALHNSANAIFTGDSHHVENIVGRKGVLSDSLFDLTNTADFRPGSFQFVKALPAGTTMNLGQDAETGKPTGSSKTVSTTFGPSLPWSVGNTHAAAGPAPTTVGSGPPVAEGISTDATTAESAKTAETTGVKYSGRSYLFKPDADFFVEADKHGSNWTQRPSSNVMKVSSTKDMHVRVWENTALDKGLLTIADVWQHNGKQPSDDLTVTRNDFGATLHPAGSDAPDSVQPAADTPKGRNLQIDPNLTLADVKKFVGGLPKDMRPSSYTVGDNPPFTPAQIQAAVADLPEPPADATTDSTTDSITDSDSSSTQKNVPKDQPQDQPESSSAGAKRNARTPAQPVVFTDTLGALPEATSSSAAKGKAPAREAEQDGTRSSSSAPQAPVKVKSHEQIAEWFSDALRDFTLSPFLSGGAALGFQQGSRPIKDLDFRVMADDAGFMDFNESNGQKLLKYLNDVAAARLQQQYHTDRNNDPSLPKGGKVVQFFMLGGQAGSRTIGSPDILGHEVSVSVVPGERPSTTNLAANQSGPRVEVLDLNELRADKLRTMISRTKTGDESVTKVAQDLFDFLDSMDLINRASNDQGATTTASQVDEAVRARFDQYRDGNLDGGNLHHLSESDLYDRMLGRAVLTARAHSQHGQRHDAFQSIVDKAAANRGGPELRKRVSKRLRSLADLHVPTDVVRELRPWMRKWNDPESFGPPPASRTGARSQWRSGAPAGESPSPNAPTWSPPDVADLLAIHADDIVANVRNTVPNSTQEIEQVVRVLAFSGGFRALDDSKVDAETLDAFGLTQGKFNKAFNALRAEGLVVDSSAGLSLTRAGWGMVPTSGPTRVLGLDGKPFSPPSSREASPAPSSSGESSPSSRESSPSPPPSSRGPSPSPPPPPGSPSPPGTPSPPGSRDSSPSRPPSEPPEPPRPSTPEELAEIDRMGQEAQNVLAVVPDQVRQGLRRLAKQVLFDTGWQMPIPASGYQRAVDIVSHALLDGADPRGRDSDGVGSVAYDIAEVLYERRNPTTASAHADTLAGTPPSTSVETDSPADTSRPDRVPEPRPGKRSRDEFEAEDGPVTTPEPPRTRPVPERLTPAAPEDTAALQAVVQPGTRFADPASFAGLINGSRSEQGRDVNCVDAALAFHATYNGAPRVAGIAAHGQPRSPATAAAEELSFAPELLSRGSAGLAEVIDRITRAGHGADAVMFGFPRSGRGHAWNVVNHNGVVSIVDAQNGTIVPATADALPWLDRVYAIPLDANGNFITDEPVAPEPPTDNDPYTTAEYERAVDAHRMREAAAAGQEIPVPGTNGRLVPGLGGFRLVGATITAELAAAMSALLGRDIIALVIGPDAEYPEFLKFSPRGRPLPVRAEV